MARIPYAEVQGIVEEEARRFGVDPNIARGIIAAENSGSPETAAKFSTVMPGAVSRANARGVMQVTPIGLKEAQNRGLVPTDWKHEDLSTDIRKGITAGVAYLKHLTTLSSNPLEIAAMYNAGPTGGRRKILPAETQLYNRKFAAATGLPMENTPSQIGGASGDPYYTSNTAGSGPLGQPASDTGGIVNQILGSLSSSSDAIGGIIQMLQGTTQRNQALMQTNAAEGQAVAAATQALTAQKAEIEYRVQSTAERTQAILGMDPEQQENELTRSVAALTAAQTQRAAVRAEYDQLAQTDFLTNPLGYIFAQLKLPSVAARHDSLAAAENAATDNINTRLGIIKAANSTLTANTAAAAKQLTLDAAGVAAQQAQIKLREEEIKNNSAMAGSAMQIAQLTDKIGDNTRQAMQIKLTQMNADESRAIRQQEFRERMEASDAARRDRKKKDAQEAAIATGLQRVSQLLGLPVAMTLEDFDRMQGATKMAWAGAAINNSLGGDLHTAINNLRVMGGNPQTIMTQNPGFGSALRKIAEARNGYVQNARKVNPATGKAPSEKEADQMGSDAYESAIVSGMREKNLAVNLTAPAWDRTFNPYKAEHEVMLDAIRNPVTQEQQAIAAALKNNIYAKTLQNLVGPNGENLVNGIVTGEQADQAFRAIAENIKAGQITPAAAAAQITQYHKLAAARNLKFYQYNLLGLPEQTAYTVAMRPAGKLWGTGDPEPVDLFNQAQVEQQMMKMVVAAKAEIPLLAPFQPYGQTAVGRGIADLFNVPQ